MSGDPLIRQGNSFSVSHYPGDPLSNGVSVLLETDFQNWPRCLGMMAGGKGVNQAPSILRHAGGDQQEPHNPGAVLIHKAGELG